MSEWRLGGMTIVHLRMDLEDLGGCARTRTVDPLIKSQLLYHLSYAPDPGA